MKANFFAKVFVLVFVYQSAALAQPAFGPARLVSASSGGVMANAPGAGCSLSASGRYVVFESGAGNLGAGDTQAKIQIYLKDRLTSLTTLLTNSGAANAPGNNDSTNALIAGDGSTVIFQSLATNLTNDDNNGRADIFSKDLTTGETAIIGKTLYGSLNSNPTMYPAISSDGQRLVYLSYQDGNPPLEAPVHADVLLLDRNSNLVQQVDVSSDGAGANDQQATGWPAISGDGRYVVFGSFATNLSAVSVNDRARVYIRDLLQGQTEHISVAPAEEEFFDDMWPSAALPLGPQSISYDGRYVAFGVTYSASPYPEAIYVRDRQRSVTIMIATSDHAIQGGALGLGKFWAAFGGFGGRYLFIQSPITNPLSGSGDNGGIFSFDLPALEALPLTAAAYHLSAPAGINPCVSSAADVLGFNRIPAGGTDSQVYIRAVDGCLLNPDKEQPGQCGCDFPDTDSDGNGVADCVEPTPTPAPTVTRTPAATATSTPTASPPPGSTATPLATLTATPTISPGLYRPAPPRFRVRKGILWMTMERSRGAGYLVRIYPGRKVIKRLYTRHQVQIRGLTHRRRYRADYAFANRKSGRSTSVFSARVTFKAP